MTDMAVTQFLIDISRGHKKATFAEDPEAVLVASGLPDHQVAAIRDQDIAALWSDGAHPMALLYFARLCGWSPKRYYACISQGEAAPVASDK